MKLQLTINTKNLDIDGAAGENLFSALRRLGFYGVKCKRRTGTHRRGYVLLDGKPINAGLVLAAEAEGHNIVTLVRRASRPRSCTSLVEGGFFGAPPLVGVAPSRWCKLNRFAHRP